MTKKISGESFFFNFLNKKNIFNKRNNQKKFFQQKRLNITITINIDKNLKQSRNERKRKLWEPKCKHKHKKIIQFLLEKFHHTPGNN